MYVDVLMIQTRLGKQVFFSSILYRRQGLSLELNLRGGGREKRVVTWQTPFKKPAIPLFLLAEEKDN